MTAQFCQEYLFKNGIKRVDSASANFIDSACTTSKNSLSYQNDIINQIANSTNKIIESVNLTTGDSTYSAVFVAIVGALSAYLFNVLQQRSERKINKIKNISSSILDLISTLEDIAVRYWVTGYSSEHKDKISIDEARIKSINLLIDKHIDIFLDNLNEKQKKQYKNTLKNFASDIFDKSTGGDFESIHRQKSQFIATSISKKCLEVITVIKSISP
ncbi:TPA: hypothetical protein PXQ92_004217 [Yersinia enterocolitica]|nr:hypothetical protein [Yersinia enterocolitica]HDL7436013.1 hypothetical protein [Yersinia enterocolitica]HDL8308333.1 hypothetical protein [Yersinia enterocolitica]